MKIVETIYQCEICGYKSNNKHKVKNCEKQGKPDHMFHLGQKVEFTHTEFGTSIIVKTIVKELRGLDELTHEPRYLLALLDHLYDDRGGVRWDSWKERGASVPEGEISLSPS